MQTEQLLYWSDMTDTEHKNIWFKRRRGMTLNWNFEYRNGIDIVSRLLSIRKIEKQCISIKRTNLFNLASRDFLKKKFLIYSETGQSQKTICHEKS